MRTFTGTGVITRLSSREIAKEDGPLLITTMRVDVKDRVKVDGQWDNYHLCLRLEMTAFGGQAKFWVDRFKEGDPIEFSGNLREEKFDKRDGTPGHSLVLEGDNGGGPYVKWLPKGFEPKKDEDQPAPVVEDESQEPPF